ncbi:MAG: hypothetical protein IH951_15935 [Bacteroidetes bacterium]|nr:hypothetical protein [Bacteroidota bacterium]
MRAIFCTFLLVLAAINVHAQGSAQSLIHPGSAARLTIMPVIQLWENPNNPSDRDFFGEVSVPVSLQIPFGRNAHLSLIGRAVGVDGVNVEQVIGMADIQAALSYRVSLGRSALLLSLAANLPSGKKELTNDEFATSTLLSQNIFRFQVPTFGQGFNLAPGLLIAVPLSDRIAIGVGGSYQIKNSYTPLAGMIGEYDPGDELLLTGGFDLRLGSTTYFSVDVAYTMYGRDQLGSEEVFGSGDKTVVSGQLRSTVGFTELWILARYRSKDKSEIPVGGNFIEESEKIIPNQTVLMGHIRFRVGRKFALRLIADGRFFDQSPLSQSLSIVGLGIGPEFAISRWVRFPLHAKYFFGDFNGIEASFGLDIIFH